jgi:hypothetical protein
MAGRLVVTTLNDDTGVLAVRNGMTGIAKAWVNFNGSGTPAIRESFNVSSITRNGTGDYTVNFTTAMPNANYVWSGACTWSSTYGGLVWVDNTYPPTTTSLRIYTTNPVFAFADVTRICIAIFSS